MKKRFFILLGMIMCLLVLSACGEKSDLVVEESPASEIAAEPETDGQTEETQENSSENTYITLEANEDDMVVIDTKEITETATFVNYDVDGAIIQLIVVRDEDDTVRVAFNTCQSCSPAPQAYFVQNGDSFVCQNCGNAFSTSQIGEERGGCNPMPVEELTETDDSIEIPASYLDEYAEAFANWQGPTAA